MLKRDEAVGRVATHFRLQGGKCCYCERKMFLVGDGTHALFATIEHKTPTIKGGSNRAPNIAAACYQCNQVKGDLDEEEFRTLLRDFGGIDEVTKELRGPSVAGLWRKASIQPLPLQPLRQQTVIRSKPRKRAPKLVPDFVIPKPVVKQPKSTWVASVWDIETQTRAETKHFYEGDAKVEAVREIVFKHNGNFGRFVCKVVSEAGEVSHLYRNVTRGAWVWT